MTIPESIDISGAVIGNYLDANFVNHGFVRAIDGRYTTCDAPAAGTGAGQGTVPITGNPAGEVVGFYFDANNALHGFLKTK